MVAVTVVESQTQTALTDVIYFTVILYAFFRIYHYSADIHQQLVHQFISDNAADCPIVGNVDHDN